MKHLLTLMLIMLATMAQAQQFEPVTVQHAQYLDSLNREPEPKLVTIPLDSLLELKAWYRAYWTDTRQLVKDVRNREAQIETLRKIVAAQDGLIKLYENRFGRFGTRKK